jgi:hypothetical protein
MTVIGALSSFRELGKMSPHKRACVCRRITVYRLARNGLRGNLGWLGDRRDRASPKPTSGPE